MEKRLDQRGNMADYQENVRAPLEEPGVLVEVVSSVL